MKPHDVRLCNWLMQQIRDRQGLYVFGICGAQGSGKSTLSEQLLERLAAQGLRGAILSLDDLYLTREQRAQLACDVHPLLATRGVPGTHDVDLGLRVIDQLRAGQACLLPRFDKASDDRHPAPRWTRIDQPLDVLILEGWCVAVPAQPDAALTAPLNSLEREQDADGLWRSWVNAQLKQSYPALWRQIDSLLYLQIPRWSAVLRWRSQQELDNARASKTHCQLMTPDQIADFIQYYERLTRHALQVMPERAAVVRQLGEAHEVLAQHFAQFP